LKSQRKSYYEELPELVQVVRPVKDYNTKIGRKACLRVINSYAKDKKISKPPSQITYDQKIHP